MECFFSFFSKAKEEKSVFLSLRPMSVWRSNALVSFVLSDNAAVDTGGSGGSGVLEVHGKDIKTRLWLLLLSQIN